MLEASKTFIPPSNLSGDGIIICGEDRYWPGIVVAAELLRSTNSSVPMQVWYNGKIGSELDDMPGVTLIDVAAVRGDHPARILRGWDSKTYAILHSGFRRVLYLDADAYCVSDPKPLFSLLDDTPFAFWKDLPHFEGTVRWEWYGIEGKPLLIQGGHLLIDVLQFWRELSIAHWLNQHSDYFYAHQYGDQDSYRVALAATGSPYLQIGDADWQYPAFICRHSGIPYIVHRCQGKLYPSGAVATNASLPREGEVLDLFYRMCPQSTLEAARHLNDYDAMRKIRQDEIEDMRRARQSMFAN